MSEEISKDLFLKDLEPFDLGELMDPEYLKVEGVSISQIPVESFYRQLDNLQKNKAASQLKNSVAACSGGLFRSSYMNVALFNTGVELSHKHSPGLPGMAVTDFIESMEIGKIDPEGKVKPLAFPRPVRNLFIGIDTEGDEKGILFNVLCSLKRLQKKLAHDIDLNIIIVNGLEEDHQEAQEEFPKLFRSE